MALQFTEIERSKLIQRGLRNRPKSVTQTPGIGFDAVWAGRNERDQPIIRGWLNTMAFEEETILAMVLNHGAWDPSLRQIPDEEVIWFLRGPTPPGRDASIASPDPLLNLPGERDAYRLRRILGISPSKIVQPSELISRQPSLSMRLLVRNPNSNVMGFGLQMKGARLTFLVDAEGDGEILEASAAFSLLWWYLRQGGPGYRQFEWDLLEGMLRAETRGFGNFFHAYQALRLPALRLALEYRASPFGIQTFTEEFAHAHRLPIALVASRLDDLVLHQASLSLF